MILFLLLFASECEGATRGGRGDAELADSAAIHSLTHSANQSISQPDTVHAYACPWQRRATAAATTRMTPQIIGLIALLVASGLLALLVLVRRHQRRSRRLRAAALGLQPSPSPDADAPLPTRHWQI